MSPIRIILTFVVSGVAVYEAIAYPAQAKFWYILAAVSFVIGIIRILKYRSANSQSGAGTGSGTQNQS